jgi:hypothetical protein
VRGAHRAEDCGTYLKLNLTSSVPVLAAFFIVPSLLYFGLPKVTGISRWMFMFNTLAYQCR